MHTTTWQKSSYCGEGESCVHVAATPTGIHITESADPGGAILTLTPDTFRTLLRSLKEEPNRDPQPPALEVATAGDDGRTVRLHAPGAPTVTTDRHRPPPLGDLRARRSGRRVRPLRGVGHPTARGNRTAVSSSETSHRRRAASGSLAAGERPTSVGAPRISRGPSGPT